MSQSHVNAFKPILLSNLLLGLLFVSSHTALAADDNELSGVAIQKNDSGVSLLIDAQKTPGAKVQKQKNGTVVITLPKTQLPKAYQEYGMPELRSGDTGLSAKIQSQGDGLRITVPKGATVPLNIRFRNGGLTTVTHSQTAAGTTPSKTTAKPKTVTKAPAKATTSAKATKPVAKAPATTTAKPATSSAAKPVASSTAKPVKTPPTGTAATPIQSSPLALPKATQKGAQAASVVEQTSTMTAKPPAEATPAKGEIPPSAAAAKPVDMPKTKPMIPETDVNAPLTPVVDQPTDPLSAAQSQVMSFLQSTFGTSDIQQWIFPLLAIFGAGLMLISLVLIVLRRLVGGGQKRPKTPKSKPMPMPETTDQYSDDAFFAGSPPGQADPSWAAAPAGPMPAANSFDDYLEPEPAMPVQAPPPVVTASVTPVSNSSGAPVQAAPQGVDERFARLAQRSSRQPRR